MGLHTYTRMVDHSLKIFLALHVLAPVLPGCVGIITSATVGSTVVDRYEKHQLEKRIEELEKTLDKEKK